MTVENEQRLVEELRVAVDERDQARERLTTLEEALREVDAAAAAGDLEQIALVVQTALAEPAEPETPDA